jgi:peptide/nickel transport system substrate-binding protein
VPSSYVCADKFRGDRRSWREAALVCAVIVLAAFGAGACGTGEESGSEREAPPDKPVRGGTLTAAISSDPGILNPATTTSGAVHEASEILYNGLVSVNQDLEPVPELAESWEVEDGGATYRFTLRDGVKWHDGEPFTSGDVKFSFEKVLLEFHSRTAASVGPALDSVETPDEKTVVFNFKQPYAPFLLQLDVTEAPIIPKHIYEGSDPLENPANTEPVGTGPFEFVSYKKGSEIRYKANPDYFVEDQPYLDEVVMRIIPDPATQIAALESGEVDWVGSVSGPDLARLQENPDIETIRTNRGSGGSNCIMTMSFNLQRPIFQEPEVRRAVAHALDRQRFVDQILFGAGRVAEAPISSGIPWAHAEGLDMPAFDKAEAERLLDEAGWKESGDGPREAQGVEGVPDGTPLAFDFVHFTTFAKYGELVRQQLGEVGIDVELVALEPEVFPEPVFVDRDFDTNVISYCNGLDPEIGVRRMYTTENIGPVPFSNSSAYSNEEVDALFEEGARTTDRDERAEIYRDIQERVVQDLPYVWLVETVGTRAHTASCSGFNPTNGRFAEAAYCSR